MYRKLHSFEWSFFIISSARRYTEAHSKNSHSSAEHCACDKLDHAFTSHSRIVMYLSEGLHVSVCCCLLLRYVIFKEIEESIDHFYSLDYQT